MKDSSLPPEDQALPIATVARETGLAKDTLRVWERRYGFPRPGRDASGDRRYPAEQVERLKLIGRLVEAGHRPGKIVGLDSAALHELAARVRTPGPAPVVAVAPAQADPPATSVVSALLDLVQADDHQALRQALLRAQLRMGVVAFVKELVAPLTVAVGEAWAQGRLQVFQEHLYTEVLTNVLRQIMHSLAGPAPAGPRVLLTTLPGEAHGLGLLMVETLLVMEGCACVPLGVQTPLAAIDQAARAHRADVVALSFTAVQPEPLVLSSLNALRARLPGNIALWVGGACEALYRQPLPGIEAARTLDDLLRLRAQWRPGPAPG